jgi:large repetitive protein
MNHPNSNQKGHFGPFSFVSKAAVFGASLALTAGVFLVPSVASAAGTTANAISASGAPSAGSTGGSYTPSATATSGDKVTIALDKDSSGCSYSSSKVSFTGSGTCLVDFNDPGNTTYAAATQVQQSIKVYSSNTISVSAAPSSGSTHGSYSPGASATSGDTVVRSLESTSTGCSLSGNTVTFTGAGTCRVEFNDPGNGAFAAAAEVHQDITVHSSNTISVSTPPAAGTINSKYSASASATSGDTVVITLSSASTGCSIDKNVVTFTGNGECIIDFNDVGNGAYAAATEVQQSITAGSGNPHPQSTIALSSTFMTHGHPLTLTAVGGSGTGGVSFAVTSAGSAGCYLSGNVLKSHRPGTCTVTVTKAGDSYYESAKSSATTVVVAAQVPKATRLSTAVWTGRTITTNIIGKDFYGSPRVLAVAGTRVHVLRDNGHVLRIRVTVAAHTPRGEHTMTLVFARGQRTSIRYNQR